MTSYNPQQLADFDLRNDARLQIPAWAFAGVVITLFTVLGIGVSYHLYSNLNLFHILLSLFFSINLLICYWEICLYLRRDYIEQRTQYWQAWQQRTGKVAAVEFLSSGVSLRNMFSPTFWADVWSTYAQYDGSYANRKTYGFNADVGNGFFTPIPSLLLHLGFTVSIMPATWLGILGIMLFWQWIYTTGIYWVSFFMAGRHKRISKSDLYVYIWGTNSPWMLFSLLGLYVSIRFVIDGDYSVIGH